MDAELDPGLTGKTVYAAVYTGRYGDEITLHSTEKAAMAKVIPEIKELWDKLGLESYSAKMPEDPDELMRTFNEACDGSHCYDVYEIKVDETSTREASDS